MPTYEVTSPDGKTFEVTAPDGASQDDVLAYAKKNMSTEPQRNSPIAAVAEPVMAIGSGMVAKPLGDVAGLAGLGMEGLRRMGVPFGEVSPLGIQQSVQNALTYQPRTEVGQQITEYNPLALLGKGVNWLAGQAQKVVAPEGTANPWQNALGYGVHELVNQAPMFIGLKAPSASAGVSSAMQGGGFGARGLMQSSLKPPIAALESGKAARAIDTMLEEGINVSKGGVEKLDARIDAINNTIKQTIANSPAVIDKAAVASRLQGALDKFKNQVRPLTDIATIQSAWDEFMSHPLLEGNKMPLRADQERPSIQRTIRETAANQPGPALANILEQVAGEQPGSFTAPRSISVPPPAPMIPVQQAQAMKQETYKQVGDRAYAGTLQPAAKAAEITLARGLKEEIANAVPAVRTLNAEESKLLNALSLVERRALLEANKNPMGLSILTTKPTHFIAFMADRSALFKSIIARMLNAGGNAMPSMNVAGPLMGAAVTGEADAQGN